MNLNLDFLFSRGNFKLSLNCSVSTNLTGIFGKSGSGKTTLLETLAGLHKPQHGAIKFNDRILVDTKDNIFISPQKRRISLVFQDLRLFEHLGVEANLNFGRRLLAETDQKIKFEEVIKILELEKFLSRPPESLSGGERQRVAIGRALLCSPELLLLDEPFSAIDHGMKQTILPYLSKIEKAFNIPMLIVSHHLPDLLQLTDHILLLEDGALKAQGEANSILKICKCSDKKLKQQ